METPERRAFLVCCLLAALLAGCSGGGGNEAEAEERVGVLHAGRVQGVDFITPSRRGTTDANGRFTYLPGEQVTFSVGGVTLGSAVGVADISLFTLARLTPPGTERALRRSLDSAMRTSSAFTRAMNIGLLLIELDADGNPENGLDVRNRRATLAGAHIDFELPLREFESTLYRQLRDVTHNIPPLLPITWLYGSLGLRVPVHAQARVDHGWGTRVDIAQIFSYRANGAIAADELDSGGDGVVEQRIRYEYDALHRVLRSSIEEDIDGDQVMDLLQFDDRVYDARGDISGATGRFLGLFGQATLQRLAEIEHDAHGRATRQVFEFDFLEDGVVDSRQVFTAEYDERGNGRIARWTFDDNFDGTDDLVQVSTHEYDAQDRVKLIVQNSDDGADGTVDSRTTWRYEYGGARGPVSLVVEVDSDADGDPDFFEEYEWGHDRAGNITTSRHQIQPQADGVVRNSVTITREFDAARRVTRQVVDEDLDGDGVVEIRQARIVRFDDLGNVLSQTTEYDDSADGIVDARVVEGSEYGEGGELLAVASSYDFDGDGTFEAFSSQRVSHTLFEDGVLHLAQWYFMRRSVEVDGAVAGG